MGGWNRITQLYILVIYGLSDATTILLQLVLSNWANFQLQVSHATKNQLHKTVAKWQISSSVHGRTNVDICYWGPILNVLLRKWFPLLEGFLPKVATLKKHVSLTSHEQHVVQEQWILLNFFISEQVQPLHRPYHYVSLIDWRCVPNCLHHMIS
jgi:hypothetical protein